MFQDRPDELDNNTPQNGQFESDTQKIVHRHLSDKEDIISEEDIRNVRVGMVPPDAISTDEEKEEKTEEIISNTEDNNEKDPNDEPLTPWDITDQ
ncbi:MAG: hypothetical protein ACM3VS_18430 [Candidatus Dadabacteria bacterium]